ncbi:MAG: tetratricopeptide repeat protein, partial [Pyrinomonadaceae bacterium]|nr:tetratricopeptide repeat protein [Pyrinomonadaceae bacterium]
YPTARHWYALYLTAMGRRAEAMTEIKRALDLDPLSLPINLGVGLHHHMMRDYERAVEEYRKTLEMDSNFYMAHLGIGMAYEQLSRFEDAIAEYEKAIRISGRSPFVLAGIGHASAVLGHTEKARKILDELEQQSHWRYVSAYLVAVIHAGLDDKDAAFRWLQQACETRAEELLWLRVEPMLDSLRDDPRFADLLRCVRLAD